MDPSRSLELVSSRLDLPRQEPLPAPEAQLHHRMPVILTPEAEAAWLEGPDLELLRIAVDPVRS